MEEKRAIDRVLTKEVAERVAKVRGRKIRGDFFSRGFGSGDVFCRGCGVKIVEGGRLLSNYRNVEFEYEPPPGEARGGTHRTNCCLSCVDRVRKDPEAVFCSDIESWGRTAEAMEGLSAQEHCERSKGIHEKKLKDQPGRLVEFVFKREAR